MNTNSRHQKPNSFTNRRHCEASDPSLLSLSQAQRVIQSLAGYIKEDMGLLEEELHDGGLPCNVRRGYQRYLDAQRRSLLKKYTFSHSKKDAEARKNKTFRQFLETNNIVSVTNRRWRAPGESGCDIDPTVCDALLRARNLLWAILGEGTIPDQRDPSSWREVKALPLHEIDFSWEDFFTHCRHTTGLTVGVPFKSNCLQAKVCGPWTATPSVAPLLRAYWCYDRFACDLAGEGASPHTSQQLTIFGDRHYSYTAVLGAQAFTVPKDESIDRFCSKEATANQFLQQGLAWLLVDAYRAIGKDVESLQPIHQELARRGSIDRTIATLDLSKASDTIALVLIMWFFPPNWVQLLLMTRSSHVTIPGMGVVPAEMLSTMGNGYTFIVESLLFYCLAVGATQAYKAHGGGHLPTERVALEEETVPSAYGDDIAVDRLVAPLLIETLESCGFIVNHEKSFWLDSDPFRESCGADYLDGISTRPFQLNDPVDCTVNSIRAYLFATFNGLIMKYVPVFQALGCDLCDPRFVSLRYCLSTLAELGSIFLVPQDYPPDSGILASPKVADSVSLLFADYGFRFEPLVVDEHGTWFFPCLSWVSLPRSKSDKVELWAWLRSAVLRQPSLGADTSHLSSPSKPHGNAGPKYERKNAGCYLETEATALSLN